MTTFVSCTVACFGRALTKDNQPTTETTRRAIEVATFWHSSYQSKIKKIIATGGYPKSMLHLPEPPKGISEGKFQYDIMVDRGVPPELIFIEGDSTSTLLQFFHCIRRGFLQVGAYSAKKPLIFSTSTTSLWRLAQFARCLKIPKNGLLRLHPGNDSKENTPVAQRRERDLTVVTRLAIDTIEKRGLKLHTGNHEKYFEKLYKCFRDLWRDFEAGNLGTFEEFIDEHNYTWPPKDVPIVEY